MADVSETPTGGGEGSQPVQAEAKTDTPPPSVDVKIEESKPQEAIAEPPKDDKPIVEQTQPEIKPQETKDVKMEASSEPKTEVKPTEVEPNAPIDIKPEATSETKPEAVKPASTEGAVVENKAPDATQSTSNGIASTTHAQGDWQQRETELLKKIEELENVKTARAQDSILLELKVREEEIDLLKARVKNLETELQAALSKPSGKNHEMIENIKRQHEELLSKARGMIFDKTKMVKNQELQIEALSTQIQSLKDINSITKNLLEIRNSECKAMEDRLQAMEARFKVEKERYGLVLERAQTSNNINDDLRKEYETQLKLFKELREKYDQRVQALVNENEKLKASLKPTGNAAPGTSE